MQSIRVDYPLRQTMCSKCTTTTATTKTTLSITCVYSTAIVTMSFTVSSVYDADALHRTDSYSEEPDDARCPQRLTVTSGSGVAAGACPERTKDRRLPRRP